MEERKKKQFQIRNHRHLILGSYSEGEIVTRIVQGKYRGDEEVSLDPFVSWQKISSHPSFYDAFLKRLFVHEYSRPPVPGSKGSGDEAKLTNPERAQETPKSTNSNQFETKTKPVSRKEVGQATQQHDPGNPWENDSEIQNLFLQVIDEENSADFEENISAVFDSPENVPIDRSQQTQPSTGLGMHEPVETRDRDDLFFEETQSTDSASVSGAKRKRLLTVGSVVAGLVFLYRMGQTGPEVQVTTPLQSKSESETVENLAALNPSGQLNRQEFIAALSDEAAHFYELDTPLHISGAQELFQEALKFSPDDPQLIGWLALSKAHLFEQDPNNKTLEESIKSLISTGRKIDPHRNAFYRAEALLAYFQKNNEDAAQKTQFAFESDPTDVDSLILEAEILNSMADRTQAKIVIDKVIMMQPRLVRAYSVAARIYLDLGDLETSERYAKVALQINQLHANTHFVLSEVYARQGKRGAAIAHLDLVAKLAPLASRSVLADTHFTLAKLLEEQGNLIESEKHNKLAYYFSRGSLPGLKQKLEGVESDIQTLTGLASEQEYKVDFYTSRAEELLSENQALLALEYLQVSRLLQPNNPEPIIKVAELLERLAVSYEKLKRVEILYGRAITKDPNYVDSYVKLSAIENDQYNFQNAYKLLVQASEVIGLTDIPAYINRGCKDKGVFSSTAKDEYKVYLAWGKHFFKRENYECAAAFLQQAQISSPVNSEVFFYFGRLAELYKTDDLQRVVNSFYQAFTIDSSNYEALAGWARAKTKMGEKNYVIKYLRALIESDPRNADLFWVLAEAYSENQEYQRAITFYKKSLDYNPRLSKSRISLARVLSAVGQTYEAIGEYTFAASSDRRYGVGFFEAAQLQTINKKYQDAELLVKALIEATPNYPGSHRLLSQIYQFIGRKEEAMAEMEKETQNNPQNTKFSIDLAELYYRYDKYDSAIKVLSKIVNLPGEAKAPAFRADRTQAFLQLSRSYRALNLPRNAEGAIKLALEIDKDDPELHRELGYVYHDLQRYREGVKEFELYLQRKPAGFDVESIKSLIKKMAIEE